MYYTMSYASPLGAMTIAANETALVGLWFDGQKYDRDGLKGGCGDGGRDAGPQEGRPLA